MRGVGSDIATADAEWQAPEPDQVFAKGNPVFSCCVTGTLPMRNAFLPLVAVQVEGAASPTARKLLRWFEAKFGKPVDTDEDGHDDAYCYETERGLGVSMTGNMHTLFSCGVSHHLLNLVGG